jgi:hypothetical protein
MMCSRLNIDVQSTAENMQPSKSRELLEKEIISNEVALHNKPDRDLKELWDQAEVVLPSDTNRSSTH